MKDLSALTAKTGVEYAMFTKGGERLVVRGNQTKVNIGPDVAKELAESGYRWSGHTHPGDGKNVKQPSEGDYAVLKAFGQKKGVIYDQKGQFIIFGEE